MDFLSSPIFLSHANGNNVYIVSLKKPYCILTSAYCLFGYPFAVPKVTANGDAVGWFSLLTLVMWHKDPRAFLKNMTATLLTDMLTF